MYSLTNEEGKKRSGSIYSFELSYLDRGYILVGSSETDKKEWIEALSKAKVHSTVLENVVETANTEKTSPTSAQPAGFAGFDNDDDDD